MVRLHTSLLALTFAVGLVLASSDDYYYQRRDDELFERDLQLGSEIFFHPHFDKRSDTFDEPEARSFISAVLKIGEKIGEKSIKGRVGTAMKVAKTAAKHGKSARKIEQRLKPSRNTAKQVAKQANKYSNYNQNNANQNNANQNNANRNTFIPMIGQFHPFRARGLEDDEELSRRDLDAEEVFGREYDLLDERNTFYDLD